MIIKKLIPIFITIMFLAGCATLEDGKHSFDNVVSKEPCSDFSKTDGVSVDNHFAANIEHKCYTLTILDYPYPPHCESYVVAKDFCKFIKYYKEPDTNLSEAKGYERWRRATSQEYNKCMNEQYYCLMETVRIIGENHATKNEFNQMDRKFKSILKGFRRYKPFYTGKYSFCEIFKFIRNELTKTMNSK